MGSVKSKLVGKNVLVLAVFNHPDGRQKIMVNVQRTMERISLAERTYFLDMHEANQCREYVQELVEEIGAAPPPGIAFLPEHMWETTQERKQREINAERELEKRQRREKRERQQAEIKRQQEEKNRQKLEQQFKNHAEQQKKRQAMLEARRQFEARIQSIAERNAA